MCEERYYATVCVAVRKCFKIYIEEVEGAYWLGLSVCKGVDVSGNALHW